MTHEELREKAEKKVEAKRGFYTTVIVFSFVTVVLIMLSYAIPDISFWLMLPIPLFVMVLMIVYISAFGSPFIGGLTEDSTEEEIEREMFRLYLSRKGQLEDLPEADSLELKELEKQKQTKNSDEDYV